MLEQIDYGTAQKSRAMRVWLARGVAVVADLLQIAIFPATAPGILSPIDDGLDVVVAVILTALVGWNIAFVPSFIIKVIPFADLAPTWTLAIMYATRGGTGAKHGVARLDEPLPLKP